MRTLCLLVAAVLIATVLSAPLPPKDALANETASNITNATDMDVNTTDADASAPWSKFTGGKGGSKGPGGGFDFSKFTGGKDAGKGPGGGGAFDFSKFMGGGKDAGKGPGGGFDFSKFMGGKGKTGGAAAKGPGGGFDFSKFMGGASPGGAGGKKAGQATSNADYLKSIGMGGADKKGGAAANPGAAFDDAMEHLKKLKALLDAGVITQADFDLKKGEVLEKI